MHKRKKSGRPKREIKIPTELRQFYDGALSRGLTPQTLEILLKNDYNNISTISAIEECDLQELNLPLAQKSVLRKLITELSKVKTQQTPIHPYPSHTERQPQPKDGKENSKTPLQTSNDDTFSVQTNVTERHPQPKDGEEGSEISMQTSEYDMPSVQTNVEKNLQGKSDFEHGQAVFKPKIEIILSDDDISEETSIDTLKSGDNSTQYRSERNYAPPKTTNQLDKSNIPVEKDDSQKDVESIESIENTRSISPSGGEKKNVPGISETNLVCAAKSSSEEDTDWESDSSYNGDSEDNSGRDSDRPPTKTLTKQHLMLKKTTDEKADKPVKIGLKMSRKDKRVSTKNTLVQGATGCIIGENIQIIKNQAKDVPVDPEVQTLIDQTGKILASYKQELELFLKTEAYKVIKEELESVHFITLTGRPGDGKTLMALQLLLEHETSRQCFILESPEMWNKIASLNIERIALVDDVFGTYVYDESKAKPWISRFENMDNLLKQEKGKLRIIFTSRAYIFEDVKPFLEKFSIFRNQYIINLSSQEFKMSCSEKRDLLKIHLKYHHLHIDGDEMSVIVSTNPPHGFPHCVKLFTTSYFLYSKKKSFFKNPIECLNAEIEKFRRFDKEKYCVLVFMAMLKGNIAASLFNDLKPKSDYIKALILLSGLPDSTPFSVLNDALSSLLSVYIRQNNDGTYVFDHESVTEAVCYSVSKSNPIFAIEKMDLNFVNDRIKTQSWKKRNDHLTVCIRKDMYLDLWKRLLNEMRSGNVKQAMKHQAWGDVEFLKVSEDLEAITDTQKIGMEFLVWLKYLKDSLCGRTVFYWAVFYRQQAFVDLILSNTNDETETKTNGDLSVALVTACYKGLSTQLLQKMIGKGASLEYLDSATEFTKYLQADSFKSEAYGRLDYAFGKDIAGFFQNGGITPLHAATLGGSLKIVEFLLDSGSKIESRQNGGRTAIHFASMNDDVIIQTVLLQSMKSSCKRRIVNISDKRGMTALHCVHSKEMVLLLLKHQADVNSKDYKGHTPLLYRTKLGISSSIIDALCTDKKCKVNVVDKAHRNALHILVRSNLDSKTTTELIFKFAELGLDFNCRTITGETPLMSAVKVYINPKERNVGSESVSIQLFSEFGADMNAVDCVGKTALHYSIDSRESWKTKLLLLNGANPMAPSYFGSPMMYLCYLYPHDFVFELMLKYVLEVNAKTEKGQNFAQLIYKRVKNGQNILHSILRSGKKNVNKHLKLLIERRIDVNTKDDDGVTAVMLSSVVSIDVLEMILENGGRVADRDNRGRNALFYVVTNELLKTNVVDCLLGNGLSINSKDDEQQTPLHYLLSNENSTVECLNHLIARGANVQLRDASGKGVFHHLFERVKKYQKIDTIFDLCEILINKGVNINDVDINGNSALLHISSTTNDLQILKLLSLPQIAKTIRNNVGQNVLHLSINSKHIDDADLVKCIDTLKETEFNFDDCDNFGQTPLTYALKNNMPETTLKLFLVTNVSKTVYTQMNICEILFKSDISSILLHKASIGKSKPEDSLGHTFPLLSNKRYADIKALISSVNTVFFPDGTSLPHFLIRSHLADGVVEEVLSLILKNNRAVVTVTDKAGRIALQVAIQYTSSSANSQRINIVRLLLEHGANPNHQDLSGRTSVHYCIQSDRYDNEAAQIILYLLGSGGDPLLTNKKGKSALEVFAREKPRFCVIVCIHRLLRINYFNEKRLIHALNFSCARQSEITTPYFVEIEKYLNFGLRLDLTFSNGRKMLHIACMYCNLQIVEYVRFILKDNKMFIDINTSDYDGRTPLHLLILSDVLSRAGKNLKYRQRAFNFLKIANKRSIDYPDITLNGLKLLRLLLLEKADPNKKDNEGNTSLHLLLKSDWYGKCIVDAVHLLLTYGADVNARTADGATPLMLAVGSGRLECRASLVRSLLMYGAIVYEKDFKHNDITWYAHRSINAYGAEILTEDIEHQSTLPYCFKLLTHAKPKKWHRDDLFEFVTSYDFAEPPMDPFDFIRPSLIA